MAEIGVAALSSLLKVAFEKLSSPVLRRLGFLFKVEEKLKSLEEETLPKIHCVLDRAEMLHFPDPVREIWLRKLKGVAYDIEDVLGDSAAKASSRYDIGKKIDKIQHRFADIANERRDLIDASNLPPPQTHLQISERRATSSLPTERSVLGRDGDKEHLVRRLLGHEESAPPTRRLVDRLTVIPIVGMGGLGKTTLAREVHNDPRVEGHFHKRIWVCVSNELNVTRITEEILEGASGNKPESGASLNTLQTKLQSELSNKRFLLVLDDVWSEDRQAWETLRAPLYFGEEGSRVVITTRSSRVADIMGAADPLLLKPLEESDFWDLFQSCAFVHGSSEKHRRLEEIGKQIVGRLKGVPLAAKTMGGLLSSNLDEGAWNDVLNSEIWKLPQRENDIMPVLRLSYQQMPAHLKPCFAFCSLFTKDSTLYKDILVRFWMAQGFVEAEGRRRMEDIGSEYFDDLVCRSFFQKVDDGLDRYLMHDLVHDLAQSISGDECVYITEDGNTKEIPPEKVLHLSLYKLDSSFEFKDLYKLKRLRTLIIYRGPPKRVPKKLFKRLRYLRVLDLFWTHNSIEELPDSIGLLKHLRYLDLSFTDIKSLPEAVGDLCNLQTLRLEFCPRIKELPDSLSLLKHLRYLDLSFTDIRGLPEAVGDLCNLQTLRLECCGNLTTLPKSMNKLTKLRHFRGNTALLSKFAGIGNLKSLQELEEFKVYREETRCNLGELKELTELRGRLRISGLENVMSGEEAKEAVLTNKQYLRTLELHWGDGSSSRDDGADHRDVLECLKPHPDLKALEIKNNDGIDFPSWLAEKHLLCLEEVELVSCRRWKVLPPLRQLSPLRKLKSRGMEGVEKLGPEFWGDKEGGFPSLEELDIRHMNRWEWDECVGLDGRELFPSLHRLCIRYCPTLRVLPTLPPTLEVLEISDAGLSALPRLWGCNEASSSSASSSTPSSSALSFLTISSCPELRSLKEGLLQHHHHLALHDLVINNCENLVDFPTQGFSNLISLKSLKITSCPNLASLLESVSLPSSLETLKISHIDQSLLPNQLRNLTSLPSLTISSSPNLTSLSGEVLRNLTALEKLKIKGCEEMSTLEIQALTSLKELTVQRCPKLTSLTNDGKEGLQNLVHLECIRIIDCSTFDSLPAELRCLSSLRQLDIRDCPWMHSLPDLPDSLQYLYITSCPELARRYKRGSSGRHSIAHIPNIDIK